MLSIKNEEKYNKNYINDYCEQLELKKTSIFNHTYTSVIIMLFDFYILHKKILFNESFNDKNMFNDNEKVSQNYLIHRYHIEKSKINEKECLVIEKKLEISKYKKIFNYEHLLWMKDLFDSYIFVKRIMLKTCLKEKNCLKNFDSIDDFEFVNDKKIMEESKVKNYDKVTVKVLQILRNQFVNEKEEKDEEEEVLDSWEDAENEEEKKSESSKCSSGSEVDIKLLDENLHVSVIQNNIKSVLNNLTCDIKVPVYTGPKINLFAVEYNDVQFFDILDKDEFEMKDIMMFEKELENFVLFKSDYDMITGLWNLLKSNVNNIEMLIYILESSSIYTSTAKLFYYLICHNNWIN